MHTISFSPVALFMQAGPVGKVVILLLAFASVVCWMQIFEAIISVFRLRAAIAGARGGRPSKLISPVLAAGVSARRDNFGEETNGETRARIIEAMNRRAREMMAKLEWGLPNLAVIASISPFVGLLGTVWGIMIAFGAIAESNETSLAVVAPGIAEALATTAFGLIAAIPASIGYSRLGASFAGVSQTLSTVIEEQALALTRAPNQPE
jgi:biopolymer transport protein ExbB